jgi:hypothetical protein
MQNRASREYSGKNVKSEAYEVLINTFEEAENIT